MKIVHKNLKKGEIKVNVENLDDIWYLKGIIDPGDLVRGQTFRKIKIGEFDERNSKTVKKKVFLTINVEKVEFDPGMLRISGQIVQGPEDVSHGSYHTFNVEEGSIIEIIKEKWLAFQLDKLNESQKPQNPPLIICVLDREDAYIALTKRNGYELLAKKKGDVAKKEDRAVFAGRFYSDLAKDLEEYDKRYDVSNIIIASPAFFKEDLLKKVSDKISDKIVLATCSSVGEQAINEVLKRQEVQSVLRKDRISKELKLVEELLSEISKEGKVKYGFKDTKEAGLMGAISILLITDGYIHKLREEGQIDDLDSLMKTVDSIDGTIHVLDSDNDAGKKLDGLGGIGAILRYKI